MAEELKVNIIGDASKLKSALGEAGGQVSGFADKIGSIGKTMTIVGGAVTAAFGVIIKKTMDAGDQFDKMSKRTGVSVENLSSLAYACDITGTNIEGLETGMKFLIKGMDDASKGTGEAKEAFAELGISVTNTEGNLRDSIDVMKEAATKIASIENPAKQAALAMEIFGARSGTQLIPLLKEGGAGIEELMNKAKELGITMSTESARAAAEFDDRLTDLKGSLAAVGRDIANILIPPLTELAKKAVEIIKKIREWADAHKPLIEIIVKVGATLGVLAAVGGPILLAVSAFSKMHTAITLLGTASTGPIGIFIIAIGAIAIGTIALTERLRETVGGMREFREELKKMSLSQLNLEIQKLTDSAEQLQKRFFEIPKGIGHQEILTMIDEINKRLKLLYERRDEIDNLTTSIDGLGEQLETTGGEIETFDEMVARMAEETKAANEAIAKSTEDLVDIMQPVYDKLYEMSHTEEEVAVRALNAIRDARIEAVEALNLSAEAEAAALSKISELYNIEVGLIVKKLEEERDKHIEVAKTTEIGANAIMAAIRKIKGEYDPLIVKVNELATVTEASAVRQVEAYKRIYNAARKLTTIKLPGGGVISTEPIVAPNVGAEYYAPTLQTGTPYVPKTGLYQLHQGEKVIPASQNTTNNSYSPSIIVNVSGNGNVADIRRAVEKALEESARQYNRRGYELVPGMG